MPTLAMLLVWSALSWQDSILPGFLGVLAAVLIVSGIDDLIPTFICLREAWRSRHPSAAAERGPEKPPAATTTILMERSIAIFVPCWEESEVIENMVRHNLAAIRYRNYDFFLGVYPNDPATLEVAHRLAETFRNVHVAECPHPGPTSKADCLNWIYQRMLLFEEASRLRFDTVVMHDAEDLIHPQAFSLIHRERAHCEMLQVPVLPLATSFAEFTHGVYCDEFAEYQMIDMPARQFSGSFIPSSGVGTAFAREIFERLAETRANRIFEPSSLTEDYECGVAIHQLGFRQAFAELSEGQNGFVATREFFPRKFRSAVRQRTRWVMGIALQSWERNGWRGPLVTRYWFWRDRKGLITNPFTLLTNLFFISSMLDLLFSLAAGRPWSFAVTSPTVAVLCTITLALQMLRLSIRMLCVGRIFGLAFAVGVPMRAFYGNIINCIAGARALTRYFAAKRKGVPLVWLKTDHAYPNREALRPHQRELADVLIDSGYLDEDILQLALRKMPEGWELADFLLSHQIISDEELCEAISLQSGVPAVHIDTGDINPAIVRTLPAHLEQRFRVLPCSLQNGRLLMAGPRVPPSSLFEEMKKFTRLAIEFQLVTVRDYERLRSLL